MPQYWAVRPLPLKTYLKVGSDVSFPSTVQASSVLYESACLNKLGGVAIFGGEDERIIGGIRIGQAEGPLKSYSSLFNVLCCSPYENSVRLQTV